MVIEALRAHVRKVVGVEVVVLSGPLGVVKLVGMLQLKGVALVVNREHSNWVEVHHIEAGRLSLISGSRADNEVHANRLFPVNVDSNLVLLLVGVRVHSPSNSCLISIKDGVESSAKLAVALILVGNVRKDDCSAIYLLKIIKLLCKPSKHVSRILILDHALPVQVVANIGIDRNKLRVRLSQLLSCLICQG